MPPLPTLSRTLSNYFMYSVIIVLKQEKKLYGFQCFDFHTIFFQLIFGIHACSNKYLILICLTIYLDM